MSYQFLKEQILERSRQLWQTLSGNHQLEIVTSPEKSTLLFLERYHSQLFPQQTPLELSNDRTILPLTLRTAELILKQVDIYYCPKRVETLLAYCDPFTAVATFLNALNFSYQQLLQFPEKQRICQAIINQFVEIDETSHNHILINEFPLYEAAATHHLKQFYQTAFAFQRAIDIILLLEHQKPRNYQRQQAKLIQFWHRQSLKDLEKTIQTLSN